MSPFTSPRGSKETLGSQALPGPSLKAVVCGDPCERFRVGRYSLLEVDVLILPVPGVGEVAGIRLCPAGKQSILGDVDGDVLRRGNDEGRPWREQGINITSPDWEGCHARPPRKLWDAQDRVSSQQGPGSHRGNASSYLEAQVPFSTTSAVAP